MSEQEKTPEELIEEERQAAIARGDILDEQEEETLEASEEPVREDDGEDEIVAEDVIEAEDSGNDDDELAAESDDESEEEKPIMIPKSRFDEAQRKARDRQKDLEERLTKYETQERQVTEANDVKELRSEIDKLRDDYETAIFEGESDKARQLRKSMEAKEEDMFAARLAQTNQQVQHAALEQMRYDVQLAQVESKYASLNPDSPDFDESVASEVADMMAAFQNTGYTATAALQKAIHYIMPEPNTSEPQEDLSGVTKEKRAVQARKKAVKTVQKSPPSLDKAGLDSDKAGADDDGLPDPMKLSEKQFEKLSAEQLAKLRGDSYA